MIQLSKFKGKLIKNQIKYYGGTEDEGYETNTSDCTEQPHFMSDNGSTIGDTEYDGDWISTC